MQVEGEVGGGRGQVESQAGGVRFTGDGGSECVSVNNMFITNKHTFQQSGV